MIMSLRLCYDEHTVSKGILIPSHVVAQVPSSHLVLVVLVVVDWSLWIYNVQNFDSETGASRSGYWSLRILKLEH